MSAPSPHDPAAPIVAVPWPTARLVGAAFLGGTLGSAARGGTDLAFTAAGWPGWGAHIAVNVAGAFAIGCLFARLSSHDARGVPTGVPAAHRLREHRWGAGFLGGFTTVSGFAWDAAHAAGEGQGAVLAAVLAANAIAGIAACAAGHALAVRPYAPPHE